MNFNSTETLKFLKFYKQSLKDIIGWKKSKQNAIKLRFKKLETFFWKQNILQQISKQWLKWEKIFWTFLTSFCQSWCLIVMSFCDA
jgi:hypothetical protein